MKPPHPAPEEAAAQGSCITMRCPADFFDNLEEAPGPEDCISYEEAQRLMAIAREHGDSALTHEQHNAIWDCLLAQPASQAWLQEQVAALQADAAEPSDRDVQKSNTSTNS